jgi:hypothetical protein
MDAFLLWTSIQSNGASFDWHPEHDVKLLTFSCTYPLGVSNMKLNFYTHDYYGNGDQQLYWVPLRRTRAKVKAIPTVPGRIRRVPKALKDISTYAEELGYGITKEGKFDLVLDAFGSASEQDLQSRLQRYWKDPLVGLQKYGSSSASSILNPHWAYKINDDDSSYEDLSSQEAESTEVPSH